MTSALKSDAAPVDTPHQPPCLVLGIETSCDETAVALVRRDGPGRGEILANIVRSQWAEHSAFGGVVPEIAARAHVECIAPIARQALREAAIPLQRVDLIAATAGPGLIGGLLAGLTFAKAIALGAGKPFIAVNHLEAHALTVGLTDHLVPPYLLLLVSGGHTQTVLIEDVGRYHRLGSTIDDALGEAFDKTAKILNLGYPGGPAVERAAINGDASRFDLPRPLARRPEPNFSFAGLKTAVRRTAQRLAAENAHADNSGTTLQSMAQPSGSNRDPAPNAAPAEARPQGGIAASETQSMAQPSGSNRDPAPSAAPAEARPQGGIAASETQSMAQPSGSNRDPAPSAAPAEARPQGGIAASETQSMAQPSGSNRDPAPSAAPAEARPQGGIAASETQSMAQPSGSNRDPAPSAAPAEARPQGGIAASETSSMAQPSLSEKDISDLCASFEAAVCDTVIDRCQRAFELAEVLLPGTNLPLVVSGGVAANARLRRALSEFATARGTQALFPPPALCTDNGAMIAWAGAERFAAGHSDAFTFEARARWPLDETATPILGAGRHGPKA